MTLTYDECMDLETLVGKRLREGEDEERWDFEKVLFILITNGEVSHEERALRKD